MNEDLFLEVEKQAILMVGANCIKNPELVAQFNRLTGCNLLRSARRTTINKMIDDACGYDGEKSEDWEQWTKFVIDCVWLRLNESVRDEFRSKALAAMIAETLDESFDYVKLSDGKYQRIVADT